MAKNSVIAIGFAIILLVLALTIAIRHEQRKPENASAIEGSQAKEKGDRPRRIIKQPSGAKTRTRKAGTPSVEEPGEFHIPEEVPTAQSSDDEIRHFLAWLSSLGEEEKTTTNEADMDASDAEGNAVDYDQAQSMIESVIRDRWKKGYETYDIERYMSAIWEDNFFYTTDLGTPDDPSDDAILRGGQQERESANRVFNRFTEGIELNLSPRSDVEFLSDTIAMVKYDYEAKFRQIPTPESRFEMIYTSGDMVTILEYRENRENAGEWRLLEWFDHARK
jgi:hypothetical protein